MNGVFTGPPAPTDHRTYTRHGWHTFEAKPGGPFRGRIFRTVRCLSCNVEVFKGGADSSRRNGWQSLIDRAAKAVRLHVAETAAVRPAGLKPTHYKLTHAPTGKTAGYWKADNPTEAIREATEYGPAWACEPGMRGAVWLVEPV